MAEVTASGVPGEAFQPVDLAFAPISAPRARPSPPVFNTLRHTRQRQTVPCKRVFGPVSQTGLRNRGLSRGGPPGGPGPSTGAGAGSTQLSEACSSFGGGPLRIPGTGAAGGRISAAGRAISLGRRPRENPGARLRGRRRHLCGVGARSGESRRVIKAMKMPSLRQVEENSGGGFGEGKARSETGSLPAYTRTSL